jgi:propionyl-CoA carboxylase beta chain
MSKRNIKDQQLQAKFDELQRKNAESLLGGGEKRIGQQHAKGKLTARERVMLLMD